MPRRLLLIALPVLLAVGCGDTFTGTQVVTVNGEDISRDTLEAELDALMDNDAYRSLLEQQLSGVAIGESEGSFDTRFVANLLTERVYLALVAQEVERRGLSVSDVVLEAARANLEQNIGPSFAELPDEQRDQFVGRVGLVLTLRSEVVPRYFEEHGEDYDEICASHILVETREDADALSAELDDGAEFAELAEASSDDTQSAAEGGDLGCQRRGTFVPPFEEAAYSLEVGEVSAPVRTEFGYHLILLDDRNPTDLEGQEQLVQSDLIEALTEEADVDVNPRYGRWVRPEPDRGFAVVPPEGPAADAG